MTDTKIAQTHTPGPWEVIHGESGRVYISGTEGDIGVLIHYERAEADARLVAAAPDLLAALKASQAYREDWDNPFDHDCAWCGDCVSRLIVMQDAAIEQAEAAR